MYHFYLKLFFQIKLDTFKLALCPELKEDSSKYRCIDKQSNYRVIKLVRIIFI